MRVLIVGATGMLGSTLFNQFSHSKQVEVFATCRSESAKRFFPSDCYHQLLDGVTADNEDSVTGAFHAAKPDVVINCVGVIKQSDTVNQPVHSIRLNALFPHQLATICAATKSRLIQVSTDCVFSGQKGHYKETDFADANDLYGRSKFLGEVNYPHCVTLRTSIIGHELASKKSLLNWFLSQEDVVKGFTRAIFSGVPVVELAHIILKYVVPNRHLSGLYHVAANPINKFELLSLIAKVYDKKIKIIPDDKLVINRSLNATYFNQLTGYTPPDWPTLIEKMHAAFLTREKVYV